jgi:acyl dehydratase
LPSIAEQIADLEDQIGVPSPPREALVEEADVRRFASVVGAPGRVDAEGRRLAPPTFVTRMVSLDRAPWYEALGHLHVLHAGERCEFHRPIRVGERLTWRSVVESITQKTGRDGRRFWLVVAAYPIRGLDNGGAVADVWRTRAVLDDG